MTSFLSTIISRSHFVDDVPDVYVLERDPKDSKYVDLALAAGVEYLVTRDHDLLDLMNEQGAAGKDFRKRFPQLRILAPGDFVQEIREKPGSAS